MIAGPDGLQVGFRKGFWQLLVKISEPRWFLQHEFAKMIERQIPAHYDCRSKCFVAKANQSLFKITSLRSSLNLGREFGE
jgi:hypothetical protein